MCTMGYIIPYTRTAVTAHRRSLFIAGTLNVYPRTDAHGKSNLSQASSGSMFLPAQIPSITL